MLIKPVWFGQFRKRGLQVISNESPTSACLLIKKDVKLVQKIPKLGKGAKFGYSENPSGSTGKGKPWKFTYYVCQCEDSKSIKKHWDFHSKWIMRQSLNCTSMTAGSQMSSTWLLKNSVKTNIKSTCWPIDLESGSKFTYDFVNDNTQNRWKNIRISTPNGLW